MRSLIGFDGRAGSTDAGDLARMLTPTGDGELTLAYVVSPGWPAPHVFTEVESETDPEAARLLALEKERLGGRTKEKILLGSSPARVLTALAESEEADQIIVGSPHRGPVGRALLGSVAEQLLTEATRPVVVAPRGFSERGHGVPSTVAAAYDGSPDSKAALERAVSIASAAGATLRVFYVQEQLPVTPGVPANTPPPFPDPADVVAEATAFAAPKIETDAQVLTGPGASALAGACDGDVDLLVVGSRGHGPLGRALLGSVSKPLLHKASCPVLVVPRQARR